MHVHKCTHTRTLPSPSSHKGAGSSQISIKLNTNVHDKTNNSALLRCLWQCCVSQRSVQGAAPRRSVLLSAGGRALVLLLGFTSACGIKGPHFINPLSSLCVDPSTLAGALCCHAEEPGDMFSRRPCLWQSRGDSSIFCDPHVSHAEIMLHTARPKVSWMTSG